MRIDRFLALCSGTEDLLDDTMRLRFTFEGKAKLLFLQSHAFYVLLYRLQHYSKVPVSPPYLYKYVLSIFPNFQRFQVQGGEVGPWLKSLAVLAEGLGSSLSTWIR